MDELQEEFYIQGSRRAWLHMLQTCLKHLGYDDIEIRKSSWVLEREETVSQLRQLCNDFGDNNWIETLSLSDVIEKHLANHLYK